MFNPAPPTIMHVDLNSCFATIEQQANPRLRGKPVAVAAYTTGGGCILTASYEAKRFGVKTGMRVREGKQLCPGLIVLPSDPEKYRFVNRKLTGLLSSYTPHLSVESIDEMVLDMANMPKLMVDNRRLKVDFEDRKLKIENQTSIIQLQDLSSTFHCPSSTTSRITEIALEIKQRIRGEIGEWLTVSIGIAPNRYLAKVASGLHKPDGLDTIDGNCIEKVLGSLLLEDLCGIKNGNGDRLRRAGIVSTLDFYRAEAVALKRAFRSVVGFSWWMRLHGYEETAFAKSFGESRKKSFGQSYALPKAFETTDPRLHQILTQLVVKMGRRLRSDGFVAGGVGISCLFADHTCWQHGEKQREFLFADCDLYRRALAILRAAPRKAVRILAINCFDLTRMLYQQKSLLDSEDRKVRLTQAIDAVCDRWGDFVVTPGRMLGMEHKVLDRIAFGKAT